MNVELRGNFRGKFVDALEQAFQNGQLRFQGDSETPPLNPRSRRLAAATVPARLGGSS